MELDSLQNIDWLTEDCHLRVLQHKGNEASPLLFPCVLGLYTSECANTQINNNVFYNFIFSNTDNVVFSSSRENDIDHYIFGINYTYKVRVLLAVEMQTG